MLKTIVFLLCMMSSVLAKDPKTLVLVICTDGKLYDELQKVWKSYMHLDPEHFECYFIRANPKLSSPFFIDEDVIWSRTQENYIPGILNKTLLSLEAFLPRLDEFDYVLRCNLSSFFVFPRLLEFLSEAPEQQFYCGLRHGDGRRPKRPNGWVCGAGIIMSKDLAHLLIENKPALFNLSPKTCYNVDDVAMGDFFFDMGIKRSPGLCIEIYSLKDWNDIPSDVYHFRIKILDVEDRAAVELPIHHTLLKMFYDIEI